MLSDDCAEIQRLFARCGLRCTRQRVAVYQVLKTRADHPTADQIFQQVMDDNQDISRATVYNTLEALCEARLAMRLADHRGAARYDAAVSDHLHVLCGRSGQVGDIPDHIARKLLQTLPDPVLRQLEQEMGFNIHQVQIVLVGEYDQPGAAAV